MNNYYTRYRHLAIEGAKPPPTPGQVAAIEALLEAPLPPAFLAFLQVANGACCDYACDVPDGEGGVETMGFNTFFSADDGDFCDETLVGELRAAREQMDMPDNILPFARDGGDSVSNQPPRTISTCGIPTSRNSSLTISKPSRS